MIKIIAATNTDEVLHTTIQCMPNVGHYIKINFRLFFIESVVHEEPNSTYISVVELSTD